MALAENVRILREKAGMTQAELGEKLGKGQTTIQKIETGQTLRPRFMNELANILGVTTYELEYGNAAETQVQKPESNVKEVGKYRLWSSNDPLPEDEYAYIRYLKDVQFKGGAGSVEMDDYNGYSLPFAKATLHRYGVNPERAVCVTLDGDSMEPVMPEGATIGINLDDTNIKDGKTYAFRHDDLFRVKRLYRLPGGQIRINSYNQDDPAFQDEIVSQEDIVIVGRVFTWSVMV